MSNFIGPEAHNGPINPYLLFNFGPNNGNILYSQTGPTH